MLTLDDDEWTAYGAAVAEHVQQRAWGNEHELLAACVELLHAVLVEIRRGVPVVQVKKQQRPAEPYRVPRPPWVVPMTPERDEVVVGPRELMAMISKG